MNPGLVGLFVAVCAAALLAFPLSGALRRHAWAFYAASLAIVAVYATALFMGFDLRAVRPLALCMQKGYLSTALLAIVMFTGCLDEGSGLRKRLQPIRGELSVLSLIFILGHLAMYAPIYLPRLGMYVRAHGNLVFSLVIALLLTALFALLGVTSLRCVRRRMDARRWKALQRLSYLMVALLALHVTLALGMSAFTGAGRAKAALAAYLVVVAAYVVLRVRKELRAHGSRRGDVADGQAPTS